MCYYFAYCVGMHVDVGILIFTNLYLIEEKRFVRLVCGRLESQNTVLRILILSVAEY